MTDTPSKPTLRARAMTLRKMHSSDERLFAAIAAAERAFPLLLAKPGIIGLYQPYRDELDPGPLIERLHEAGRQLALPVTRSRREPLLFRRYAPGDPLVEGKMSILEPSATAEEVFPEVLIVPLAAFDERCFRIGYGAGHYDRTIPFLRAMHPVAAFGYAYVCQKVGGVPNEPHDVALDAVVTEDGVVTPAGL